MTLCRHTGYQCHCQPDEGIMCPYKPHHPFRKRIADLMTKQQLVEQWASLVASKVLSEFELGDSQAADLADIIVTSIAEMASGDPGDLLSRALATDEPSTDRAAINWEECRPKQTPTAWGVSYGDAALRHVIDDTARRLQYDEKVHWAVWRSESGSPDFRGIPPTLETVAHVADATDIFEIGESSALKSTANDDPCPELCSHDDSSHCTEECFEKGRQVRAWAKRQVERATVRT